ncbi:unnamed protein product, partial [marine sediment metagenome]
MVMGWAEPCFFVASEKICAISLQLYRLLCNLYQAVPFGVLKMFFF